MHLALHRLPARRALAALFGLAMLVAPATAQITFTRTDAPLGIEATGMSFGPNWGDFNGDGHIDLWSGNHGDRPNLFLNVPGYPFADIWPSSWIPQEGDRHGGSWGDFDNDGWRDLYVTIGAQNGQGVGPNQLYHNLGTCRFEDIAFTSGTTDSLGRGRFANWIDVNNDGLLDIFVGNSATPNRLFLNRGDGTFADVPNAGGLGSSSLWFSAWTLRDDDRLMDVILAGAWACDLTLFHNSGNGTFVDVTGPSGLPTNLPDVSGLCWIDYDNDGDEDLYCSRGFSSDCGDAFASDSTTTMKFLSYLPDQPEAESGADQFEVAAAAAGLSVKIVIDWDARPFDHIFLGASGAHPSTPTFYLGNGSYLGRPPHVAGHNFGCYIWQDAMGGPWHIEASTDFGTEHRVGGTVTAASGHLTGFSTSGVETQVTPPGMDDRFFRNRGNGTFEDVTAAAGIADSLDGHSCISADFDNDGWLDLHVTNGRNLSGLVVHNGPNLLYLNNRDGTFRERAALCGADNRIDGSGGGGAWADYDQDGFPDLFITNGWGVFPFNRGPHVLYHNQGNGNHWVRLRLVGTVSNRDATGARVRIEADGQTQWRTQFGGVNDMSQNTMIVHFGLGSATRIETLVIDWPAGGSDVFHDLAVDRTYLFTEGQTAGILAPPASPLRLRLDPVAPNPLREGATLSYELPAAGRVRLEIFDPAGRCVRRLIDATQYAGRHAIPWDARDGSGRRLPRGVYCARLRCGEDAVAQRRLVLD
jgi:hypothetical protein